MSGVSLPRSPEPGPISAAHPDGVLGEVVLAGLDVDVGQQEPAALQVLGVLEVPLVLRHPLQLVTGARRLEEIAGGGSGLGGADVCRNRG